MVRKSQQTISQKNKLIIGLHSIYITAILSLYLYYIIKPHEEELITLNRITTIALFIFLQETDKFPTILIY